MIFSANLCALGSKVDNDRYFFLFCDTFNNEVGSLKVDQSLWIRLKEKSLNWRYI